MKQKERYHHILVQTIPFLLGIIFSYLFWQNNLLLAGIYLLAILILLKIKYYPGDFFCLMYGFLIGLVIEVIGTSVSGYQSFTNPDILSIPLWLPIAWAYGFMLMKRIGVIVTNHKK